LSEAPRISAVALRVRDARAAYAYVLERGGWDVPMHAQVMELNIPGIHARVAATSISSTGTASFRSTTWTSL